MFNGKGYNLSDIAAVTGRNGNGGGPVLSGFSRKGNCLKILYIWVRMETCSMISESVIYELIICLKRAMTF